MANIKQRATIDKACALSHLAAVLSPRVSQKRVKGYAAERINHVGSVLIDKQCMDSESVAQNLFRELHASN